MTPLPRRMILQVPLQVAGTVTVPAFAASPRASQPLRLLANENPYGPAESAKQAMIGAAGDGWMYDPEDDQALATLIAEREGVTPDHVVIVPGADELLKVTALVYGSAGAEVISPQPTYIELQNFAERNGAQLVNVPLDKDMRHDLAAMESRITDRTGLIYVCNPNNPTATTAASPDRLRSFIATASARAMVLVDEAYIDFCDEPAKQTVIDQVKAGRNIIVARTFSKLHGLAGLRIGYGLARPDVITRLRRLRMSAPNRLGLRAAIASYQDLSFQAYSRKMVREVVAQTTTVLDRIGLPHTASEANFVFFDAGRSAKDFIVAMWAQGIEVGRPFAATPTWCRVSMGRLEEMPRFWDALAAYFKK